MNEIVLSKIERVCAWYREQLAQNQFSEIETFFLYLGVIVMWLAWFAWVTFGYLVVFAWASFIMHIVFSVENPLIFITTLFMIIVLWFSHVIKILAL
jgi:hypothetical protein